MISNLVLVLVIGCSTVNNTNSEIKIAENKISNKLEPKKLTFSSKAVISNFTDTFKLPEGKHLKLELTTERDKEKIKIPNSGDFKIIFKKSTSNCKKDCKIQIIDNDATDGSATVMMPEGIMEGFIRLQDEGESKSLSKLTIEDKLYYFKQDLTVLSPKHEDDDKSFNKKSSDDKEKWYKLGSKPFPVPNDWHNDDGNDYILRFNNSGIKKAEMRWFKNDKVDYPNGIKEVGIEGGTVELAGIGKIEIPSGALSQKTTVVLKQELESKEIIVRTMNGHEFVQDDPASPLLRIEPMGLKLNKEALVYIETDKARLGNNHPNVLYILMSKDKNEWIFGSIFNRDNIPLELVTDKEPSNIDEFSYIGKFIRKSDLPNSGRKFIESSGYTEENSDNSFNINSTPTDTGKVKKHFRIKDNIPENKRLETDNRAESAYNLFYFSTFTNLKPCDGEKLYSIRMRPSSNFKSTSSVAHVIGREEKNGKCSYLEFNEIYKDNIPMIIEHELWHTFQNNIFLIYPLFLRTNKKWITESSAEYIGAKIFEKNQIGNKTLRDTYLDNMSLGLNKYIIDIYQTSIN